MSPVHPGPGLPARTLLPVLCPEAILETLREQLGLGRAVSLDGYFEGRSRVRHLAAIRDRFGFTDFGDDARARFRLTRWLYALCWSGDDRPGPLIDRAAAWLIANKVLLPGVTILERLVGSIREPCAGPGSGSTSSPVSATTSARASPGCSTRATQPRSPPWTRCARFHRSGPPSEFLRHLDRLEAVREFDLRPSMLKGVPAATLERLARVARMSKPSAIAALREPRRTATVAALVPHPGGGRPRRRGRARRRAC